MWLRVGIESIKIMSGGDGGGGGDDDNDTDDEDKAWEAMVHEARLLVSKLRHQNNNNDDDDDDDDDDEKQREEVLVQALEQATASVAADEEFVAALGTANGHSLLMRLTCHPHDDVSSAAADALCACVDNCPPGRVVTLSFVEFIRTLLCV